MVKVLYVGYVSSLRIKNWRFEALKKIVDSAKFFDHRKILNNYMLCNYPLFYQRACKKMNNRLIKEALKYKPDVLIVFKGNTIFPSTIKFLKKRLMIRTVLWYNDDPQYFEMYSRYLGPSYDYVFTSSFLCVPRYKKLGVENCYYIPFCCFEDFHKKIELSQEDEEKFGCDISFAGTYYPEREIVLKSIVNKGYKIKIYGNGWRFASHEVRKYFRGSVIGGMNYIKLLNASKIVLNIHNNEMKYGGMKSNKRNFEATGCGSFVLSDKPIGIEDLFKLGEEIEVYQSKKELLDKIEYYLENPKEREKIAKAGQRRTYKDHTIKQRMKWILSTVLS